MCLAENVSGTLDGDYLRESLTPHWARGRADRATHDKKGGSMTSDNYNNASDAAPDTTPTGASGTAVASFRTLSEHDRKAIAAIITSKDRIKLEQAQLRDDVKTVAERLGMKTSELNRIVRLAMQERERGNVLSLEKALIDVAEQIVM
jgi:hypothetical protein